MYMFQHQINIKSFHIIPLSKFMQCHQILKKSLTFFTSNTVDQFNECSFRDFGQVIRAFKNDICQTFILAIPQLDLIWKNLCKATGATLGISIHRSCGYFFQSSYMYNLFQVPMQNTGVALGFGTNGCFKIDVPQIFVCYTKPMEPFLTSPLIKFRLN